MCSIEDSERDARRSLVKWLLSSPSSLLLYLRLSCTSYPLARTKSISTARLAPNRDAQTHTQSGIALSRSVSLDGARHAL